MGLVMHIGVHFYNLKKLVFFEAIFQPGAYNWVTKTCYDFL